MTIKSFTKKMMTQMENNDNNGKSGGGPTKSVEAGPKGGVNWGSFAISQLPALYNIIRGATEEPDTIDQNKYKVTQKVEPYKPDITPMIRDIQTSTRGVSNQVGDNYAAQVSLNASLSDAIDKAYTGQYNQYGQSKMWADSTNLNTEMYNSRLGVRAEMFNVAQRAAPGNLIGAGLSQISQSAQNLSNEMFMRDQLEMQQDHFERYMKLMEERMKQDAESYGPPPEIEGGVTSGSSDSITTGSFGIF
jgi:hypothetical protein